MIYLPQKASASTPHISPEISRLAGSYPLRAIFVPLQPTYPGTGTVYVAHGGRGVSGRQRSIVTRMLFAPYTGASQNYRRENNSNRFTATHPPRHTVPSVKL